MAHPRIYADLHKLNFDESGTQCFRLAACYGTLADLCRHGVILQDGLILTFYVDSAENEDIEIDGQVEYDRSQKQWIAKLSPELRYVVVDHANQPTDHPCIQCRYELRPHIQEHGLADDSVCANCGTLINLPLLSPRCC